MLYTILDLTKFGVSRQIFVRVRNIKFDENPFIVGAVLLHAGRHRRTDMTKLIGWLRN